MEKEEIKKQANKILFALAKGKIRNDQVVDFLEKCTDSQCASRIIDVALQLRPSIVRDALPTLNKEVELDAEDLCRLYQAVVDNKIPQKILLDIRVSTPYYMPTTVALVALRRKKISSIMFRNILKKDGMFFNISNAEFLLEYLEDMAASNKEGLYQTKLLELASDFFLIDPEEKRWSKILANAKVPGAKTAMLVERLVDAGVL